MASQKTIKTKAIKITGGLQSEKTAAVVYRPSEGATDTVLIVLLSCANAYVRY